MEVRVELSLKMELPDDTVNLKEAVWETLFRQRHQKASELLRYLKIMDVTRVDPWGLGGESWGETDVWDDD